MKALLPKVLLLILPMSCIPDQAKFDSLLSEQPSVTEVSPEAGSTLQNPAELTLRFSQRIDFSRVNENSVTLVASPLDEKLLGDGRSLVKEILEKKLPTSKLDYLLDSGETVLTVLPETSLTDGVYYLVVTPVLTSAIGVPFNQRPGEDAVPFVAQYTFGNGTVPPPASTEEVPGGEGPGFGLEPEFLVINEILYDGQSSETDGECFVELYGTPGADISLYQILFINGSGGGETDRVTLPVGTFVPDDGIFVIADLNTNSSSSSKVPNHDFTDHFDPQNGPDGVQLLNRGGELLDSVVYGEGAVDQSKTGLQLGEGIPSLDLGAGHSLSRTDGSDTEDNATDFHDNSPPTPGVLN